ncbi:hypothetical protein KDL44_01135 [bacterium]|nr:hypothetical protein [bacterium]
MKTTHSWAMLVMVVLCACACSKTDQNITSAITAEELPSIQESVPAGLPAPSQLYRSGSAVTGVDGAAFSASSHVSVNGDSAVLEYTGQTNGKPPRAEYSYAIYMMDEVSDLPPILEVGMQGDFTSRVHTAVANWRTDRWEFGFGHVYTYSNRNFPLPDLEELPGDFVSPDGRVAMAFIKVDEDGPSSIDFLRFWEPEEVLNVVASEGLWDGIEVSWEVPGGIDYVNIERRSQGVAQWELLNPEPVAANLITYKDVTAEGGVYYEYRVSGGYRWDTVLGDQYFWTTGKKAIGLRNVDTVSLGMNIDEMVVPGNSFNRLSFYFAPTNDANGLHAVRNTTFPPGLDWELFDETSTNFPYLSIVDDADLGPGISVFDLNELNNPLVNLMYSDGTGIYAYAALLDQEGHFEWLNPGVVRSGQQHHVLGTIELERRLACLSWNSSLQRIEMTESVDNEGTFWWEYNDLSKWAVASERKPLGGILVSPTSRQSFAFREKDSNNIVTCAKGSDGWIEQVVDVETSDVPVLQTIKINSLDITGALFYRDMDRKRIRLVRSFDGETWLTNQQETLVQVKDADEIGEFVHYMLNPPSNFNVLAYTHNGNLKFRFSSKTGQDAWTEEFLLDDSGSCRNLSIIRVGTDLQWQYFTFLSYLRTDENGEAQLKFIDLVSFLEAHGNI